MNPTTPFHTAGILILPPESVAILNGVPLTATKFPQPPELPPDLLENWKGFDIRPQNDSHSIQFTNWVRLVLAIGIAPPNFF